MTQTTSDESVFERVFRIQRTERFRVAWMFLFSIAAVGGVVITGQLIGRALFLSAISKEDVPYKFLLPPIALAVTTAIYTRLAPRFRQDQLIRILCVIIAIGVSIFWYLLGTSIASNFFLLCCLFVFLDIGGSLIVIQYWTFASELFDAREAKRLFGVISSGGTLAAVLFGALLGILGSQLEARHLLLVVLMSAMACGVCAWSLATRHTFDDRHQRRLEQSRQQVHRSKSQSQRASLFQSKLMVAMVGVVVIVAIVSCITDYQLDLALQESFESDTKGMVSFLGVFRLVTGIIAIFVQLFLASRLLEKFGIRIALLLLPLLIFAGSLGTLATGGLLLCVVLPRAADAILKYTIHDSAFHLLYLPIKREIRARAKAVLDGIIKPAVLSGIGLVLLIATKSSLDLEIYHWSIPVLVLVGVWTVVTSRIGKHYVSELAEMIRWRRYDPSDSQIDRCEETRAVLLRTLETGDRLQVLHALGLIEQLQFDELHTNAHHLLTHSDSDVKFGVLSLLERCRDANSAEFVAPLLGDEDRVVRGSAARAYCATSGRGAIPAVRTLLNSDSLEVRSGAIIGLIRYAGLGGMFHALQPLKSLLDSKTPEHREAGATIIGELGITTFYDPIVDLLHDPKSSVRRAALRAATKLSTPELLPELLPLLDAKSTRADAAIAVAACLDDDLEPIRMILSDSQTRTGVRRELGMILGQNGSFAAIDLLIQLLKNPSGSIRGTAAESLKQARDDGHKIKLSDKQLVERIDNELVVAFELWRDGGVAKQMGLSPIFAEAIEDGFHLAKQRILVLIALLYPKVPLDETRKSLKSESRKKATAIELLDSLIEYPFRESVVTLFGDDERELKRAAVNLSISAVRTREELIRDHARSGDGWIAACALFELNERSDEDNQSIIKSNVQAQDTLIRDVAKSLVRQANPATRSGGPHVPLSTLEKIIFLKGVTLFENISGENLAGVVPIVEEERFDAEELIIRQGEEGDCLYIIVEGTVRVEADGKAVASFGSGDIIGELAVLTDNPRNADCLATSEVVSLRISRDDFWELLSERPEVSVGIVRELVSRYISKDDSKDEAKGNSS